MPLVRRRILGETEGVVLPAEDPQFADTRRASGDVTGSVCSSIRSASRSSATTRHDGASIRCCTSCAGRTSSAVSIKASALVANLDVLDFDRSVDRICEPLREIYRAAMSKEPLRVRQPRHGGVPRPAPDRCGIHHACSTSRSSAQLEAGIVLQAYLPDSHDVLEHLGAVGRGASATAAAPASRSASSRAPTWRWRPSRPSCTTGSPRRIRSKADVDASYKLMLESALRPEWNGALRVGVASHNLFDVAWALVQRRRLPEDQRSRIELEMLEGMAPAQSRAVRKMAGGLLLYAPVVQHDQIDASIAYLARRLDENTAPENFLRALFTITPGSRGVRRASRAVPSIRRRAQDDRHRPSPSPGATARRRLHQRTRQRPDRSRRRATRCGPPSSHRCALPDPTIIASVEEIDAMRGHRRRRPEDVVGNRLG